MSQSPPSIGLSSSSPLGDFFPPDLLEYRVPGGLRPYHLFSSLLPFMDPSFLADKSTGHKWVRRQLNSLVSVYVRLFFLLFFQESFLDHGFRFNFVSVLKVPLLRPRYPCLTW